MRRRRRNEIADQLREINWRLGYLAEVLAKEPAPDRPEQVKLPIQVTDAAELFARWLWLQLPEESKKDLMA